MNNNLRETPLRYDYIIWIAYALLAAAIAAIVYLFKKDISLSMQIWIILEALVVAGSTKDALTTYQNKRSMKEKE